MKRISSFQWVGLSFIFLCLFISNVYASILQYEFQGDISSIDSNVAKTLGVRPGSDLLSAVMSFDSNATDHASGSDRIGSYFIDLSFSLGKLNSSVQLGAYTSNLDQSSIGIGSSSYSAILDTFVANEFGMTFRTTDSNFTLTEKLPLTAFDPAVFSTREWYIFGNYDNSSVEILGTVTSMKQISQVSSPGTMLLLVAGLFLLPNIRRNFRV